MANLNMRRLYCFSEDYKGYKKGEPFPRALWSMFTFFETKGLICRRDIVAEQAKEQAEYKALQATLEAATDAAIRAGGNRTEKRGKPPKKNKEVSNDDNV